MKKRLCKTVAVLVFVCCLALLMVACGQETVTKTADGLWRYTLNEKDVEGETVKTVTLDEYLGQEAEVVVPSAIEVEGALVPVEKLGDAAFMKIDDGKTKWRTRDTYAQNKTLKKVTIGEGIKSVGNMSFYLCSALTEVYLPETLESIGDFAFFGCSSLTTITFPKSVNAIGAYSFRACSLLVTVNVLAEETLPDLGDKAFYLINEKSSGDDQYYINKDLRFYVPEVAVGLYDVDKIEAERRQTKSNNHRYWSEYINAGCFPQVSVQG